MESEATHEPVLGPLVQHAPRLLRSERLPVPAVRSPNRAAGLILTFEVGRLWIQPGARSGELSVALRSPRDASPPDAVSADEDEPWWAILGSELRNAWARRDPSGSVAAIELQFRPDQANPKIVSLALRNGELHITSHPKKVGPTKG